jgi:hypothetical protein
LAVEAVAAGLEPDPELAPAAVKGLAADALSPAPPRPRPVTLYDLSTVTRVVSFGCDVTPRAGQPVDRWDDVPAVSEGYGPARDRIVAHVERLVAGLAAAR